MGRSKRQIRRSSGLIWNATAGCTSDNTSYEGGCGEGGIITAECISGCGKGSIKTAENKVAEIMELNKSTTGQSLPVLV